MANAELSPATAARLRTLRLRVTALIALLATVAVTVFAVVVIRIDRQLRDEQAETELLRISDETVRQITFEDGSIQPATPVFADSVVAVTPSFDTDAFQAQQEEWDLPDPTDEELEAIVREIYDEADLEDRAGLVGLLFDGEGLGVVGDLIDYEELFDTGATTVGPITLGDEDGGGGVFERTELVLADIEERLVESPPVDLADEAYRRFVEIAADEAGVDLEFETTFFSFDPSAIDEDVLFTIAEAVTEAPAAVYTDTISGTTTNTFAVRATPLRDGPEVRGAVIAVLDPSDFDDAHDELRTQVIVLALAIVAGSVVAAWFVAARTISPTGRALAQQERFLADAAHELRTPIAAIRLTAESAQAETATHNLARVAELASDASRLTDDLLTLARMDADRLDLQRERVRLDLLAESTVAAIPEADGVVEISGAEAIVDGDPGLLERAIGNLVRNAIAHGHASAASPAELRIDRAGSTWAVTVRDRGPGIDAEIAAGLFERFRSRTGSAGHGLGLPLARWIARAHGGDLQIDSTVEPGTAFVLTLPA